MKADRLAWGDYGRFSDFRISADTPTLFVHHEAAEPMQFHLALANEPLDDLIEDTIQQLFPTALWLWCG